MFKTNTALSTTWKTVRVFISSTFRDMQAERDHLVRFVFPRLRKELLQRRIHLLEVDLRWGVTSSQNALEVCREIVDECRPWFLCILGGRYGWVPPGKTRSITADEVHYGVLDRAENDRGFTHFYFRDLATTECMIESKQGEFQEPEGSDNRRLIDELKQSIVNAGLQPFTYSAQWDDNRKRLVGLREFGERVFHDLLADIDAQFGTTLPEYADEFTIERAAMDAFVEERNKRFVIGSRGELIEALLAHAGATDGRNYLSITGSPGCGKSALLSHFVQHWAHRETSTTLLIPHFVGASSGSTDIRLTLRRFCHELKAGCPGITGEIPEDHVRLREVFEDFLTKACATRRVVIVCDAFNQFDRPSQSYGTHWVPHDLPPNCRFIFSTVDGHALEKLRQDIQELREIEIAPLTVADGEAIIEQFLGRYRKHFEPEQRASLLSKAEAGLPLYLLAALEEIRTQGTYEEINQRIIDLPPTTQELFSWILQRLAMDGDFQDASGGPVAKELVSRFFSFLCASRQGLSQRELIDLVDAGDPEGNVAALLQLIRPYLMRRGEILDFYHDQFRVSAQAKYLSTTEEYQVAHRKLVAFFRHDADPCGDHSWRNGSPRALRELPHHTFEAQLYDHSFKIARDDRFVAAQAMAFPAEPLLPLECIQAAIRAAASLNDAARMAEFSLRHVEMIVSHSQSSPMEALRTNSIHRAWQLADAYQIEHCVIWHLFLAVTLKQDRKVAEAVATLERLDDKFVPRLSESQAELSFRLLLDVADLLQERLIKLPLRLLGEKHLLELSCVLATQGQFALSMKMVREAESPDYTMDSMIPRMSRRKIVAYRRRFRPYANKPSALASIAMAQLDHVGRAQFTLRMASESLKSVKEERDLASAYAAIGEAFSHSGDFEKARRAFSLSAETAQKIELGYDRACCLYHLDRIKARVGGLPSTDTVARQLHDEISRAIEEALQDDNKENRSWSLYFLVADLAGLGDFPGAVKTAERIERSESKACALSAIAVSQVEAGIQHMADRTIKQALEVADSVTRMSNRVLALEGIASALIRTGNRKTAIDIFARAARAIRQTLPAEAMARSYMAVAVAHLDTGDPAAARQASAEALRLAQKIGDPENRAFLLQDIAKIQDEAGARAEALRTSSRATMSADRIEDEGLRLTPMIELVEAQARAGNFRLALDTAHRIRHPQPMALAFLAVAEVQGEAGHLYEMYDSIRLATDMLEHTCTGETKFTGRLKISEVLAKGGDKEGARESLELAISSLEQIAPDELTYYLRKIAETQMKIGDPKAARRNLKVASQTACLLDLKNIASTQIQAGDPRGASLTFAKAVKAAGAVEDTEEQILELLSIAQYRREAGDEEGANQTMEQVFVTAEAGVDVLKRGNLLCSLSEFLARTGFFVRALDLAERITEEIHRAAAFQSIAIAQARKEDRSGARESFAQAVRAANFIVDNYYKSSTLSSIAESQALVDFGEDALRNMDRIVYLRTVKLIKFADSLVEAGNLPILKEVVVLSAHYADATFKMISLLLKLYPKQVSLIDDVVRASRLESILLSSEKNDAMITTSLTDSCIRLPAERKKSADALCRETEQQLLAGNLQEAIVGFTDVIRQNPNHVASYLGRGKAKKASGDLGGALSDLRKAQELSRKDLGEET